jgi:hypothetical protein
MFRIHKVWKSVNVNNAPIKIREVRNRHFLKESTQMDSRYMKQWPTTLIRNLQIKPTMTYLITTVREAKKNTKNNKGPWGCRERGSLVQCLWQRTLVHYKKLNSYVWAIIKKIELVICMYSRNMKSTCGKNIHMHSHETTQ